MSFLKYIVGAGTGAAALSTYQTVEQGLAFKDAAQETVGQAAVGFAGTLGAMLGTAKAKFQSSTPSQPQITYIHTDRGRGPSSMTIVVLGATGVVVYGGACYYFGWDFLGVSRRRAEALMHRLNDKVAEYSQRVQSEIDKLRGKIDEGAVEQQRQAELLEQVNNTVQPYGKQLDSIGLQNSDIAQALYCAQLNHEATSKGVMALNYLLIKLMEGTLSSRDEALQVLHAAMGEQMNALPASVSARMHLQGEGRVSEVQQIADSSGPGTADSKASSQVVAKRPWSLYTPLQVINGWWTGSGRPATPAPSEHASQEQAASSSRPLPHTEGRGQHGRAGAQPPPQASHHAADHASPRAPSSQFNVLGDLCLQRQSSHRNTVASPRARSGLATAGSIPAAASISMMSDAGMDPYYTIRMPVADSANGAWPESQSSKRSSGSLPPYPAMTSRPQSPPKWL